MQCTLFSKGSLKIKCCYLNTVACSYKKIISMWGLSFLCFYKKMSLQIPELAALKDLSYEFCYKYYDIEFEVFHTLWTIKLKTFSRPFVRFFKTSSRLVSLKRSKKMHYLENVQQKEINFCHTLPNIVQTNCWFCFGTFQAHVFVLSLNSWLFPIFQTLCPVLANV